MSGGLATIRAFLLPRLLPGVPGESNRWSGREADGQELLQLPQLAIGQGIHRVDGDGLDPPSVRARRLGRQDPVDHRDDVGQALPRPGPGGQHIAAASASRLNGLALMPVQSEHRTVGIVLLQPEDPLAFPLEHAQGHEFADRPAGGEARIEGKPRVRPLVAVVHALLDMLADALVVDIDKAAGEVPVVLDQPVTNPEDVHVLILPHPCSQFRTANSLSGTVPPRPPLSDLIATDFTVLRHYFYFVTSCRATGDRQATQRDRVHFR